MIQYTKDIQEDILMETARRMCAAAVTAPKASGQDKVVTAIATGRSRELIAEKMRQLGEEYDEDFIRRDAGCLERCPVVVLIGVKNAPFGLDNCHYCGFENCAAMAKAGGRCAINVTDLGIAVGSAVSVAADARIDNRVMYSIGKAVVMMDILPKDVEVCYGIPLSISSKSIFFDRGAGDIL